MRVAFITSETFVGKRRGGFGWLVRTIGRELVRRGFDVTVLAWRDPGCPERYSVDGVEVVTYPYAFETKSVLRHLRDYHGFTKALRKVKADAFISIEAMVETLIAEALRHDAKHIIWAQDPVEWSDIELARSVNPYYYGISKVRFALNRFVFGLAYWNADLVLTQAKFYVDKLRKLYKINPNKVIYLPNPVDHIPTENRIEKSDKPMVCYLARMDPEKRYWIFFELARKFPDIQFVALGAPSMFFEKMFKKIAEKYRTLPNLKLMGFLDGPEKWKILDKCWILILPSIKEGLPIAMLEGLAHKCALLSSVNPDGLTERFGYWVRENDFIKGLKWLLEDGRWRGLGEEGYKYVKENHDMEKIIGKLISLLEKLSRE
jgi:glycosyltransferase involved in cell wall biosynthesis